MSYIKQTSNGVDKKGIIRAMSFAILAALLGIGFLGWQYNRLEDERLPALEEKIEKSAAEDVLDKFMQFRIRQNETAALHYLTEGAVAQKEQGEFNLVGDFDNYEVLSGEKMAAENYRFAVRIYDEGALSDFIEVITLIKITDKYYIDSVVIAG